VPIVRATVRLAAGNDVDPGGLLLKHRSLHGAELSVRHVGGL
jgi:hypothetical protein